MRNKTEFWHAARQAVLHVGSRPDRKPAKSPFRQQFAKAIVGRTPFIRLEVTPPDEAAPFSFALANDARLKWRNVKLGRLPLQLSAYRAQGAVTVVEFALPSTAQCWGLGERYGGLDQRSRVHTLITTDDHSHQESSDALYKSIPVLYLMDGAQSHALFVDSPAPQRWDLDSRLDERGSVEIFTRRGVSIYLLGPAPLPQLVAAYTLLTGRTPLPPRFSLGHQQSRWSYPDESTIRAIATEFRNRRIPCDAVVADIDYMEDYRAFTISRERFPKFEGMISDLGAQGFKLIPIVDPGILKSRRDATYVAGTHKDVFCRTVQGDPFVGKVWPGKCCFPDFVREDVREFWGERLRFLFDKGVGGIWNDMNEPALFGQQRPFDPSKQQLPKASDQMFLQTAPEGTVGHLEVRGLYGMQMARAAFEAQLAARPDQRVFTLTRSTYAGGQRYGAVWLGDNKSWFEHLRLSIPMLMNVGLCGFAQSGVDIGGFGENADGELLIRWYQTGIFYPFFRNHCAMGQRPQEPWAFGPKVERAIRKLIRARYRLTRYVERLFVEHRESGAPLMRPLAWHYPDDSHAWHVSDQFLFGEDLLVAPILNRAQRERMVYLPEGCWEPFDGGAVIPGPTQIVVRWGFDEVPAFVRHGAILPLLPAFEHMGQLEQRTILLKCYGQNASGRLWLDDGESLAYQRGEYDDWQIQLRSGRLSLDPRHLGYAKRPKRVLIEAAGQQTSISLSDLATTTARRR